MNEANGAGGVVVTPEANEGARGARNERWHVWKHDCIKHGMGDGIPCLPRCDDPWQADDPRNKFNATFATWDQAIAWANSVASRRLQ